MFPNRVHSLEELHYWLINNCKGNSDQILNHVVRMTRPKDQKGLLHEGSVTLRPAFTIPKKRKVFPGFTPEGKEIRERIKLAK